jgi:anti-anti-sigma regulatory factor
LEFIDSTGIGMLMHTKRLLTLDGRGFRVANLTGMPLRSFELVGLTEVFGIDKSKPSGVQVAYLPPTGHPRSGARQDRVGQ